MDKEVDTYFVAGYIHNNGNEWRWHTIYENVANMPIKYLCKFIQQEVATTENIDISCVVLTAFNKI